MAFAMLLAITVGYAGKRIFMNEDGGGLVENGRDPRNIQWGIVSKQLTTHSSTRSEGGSRDKYG